MSEGLFRRILLLINEHSRHEPSRYVEDSELAEATGADIEEVRRQMDVLESRGWTKTANSHDGRAALIAPEGIVAAEELLKSGEPPPRPIGF